MTGFAVVGLGMGRNRAKQVLETVGAELRLVVDLNEDLAREVGGEMGCDFCTDLGEALGRADVDVIVVMTPSGLHAKIGVEAIQAGKHVITTKPMDVSTKACDELINAADAAGVPGRSLNAEPSSSSDATSALSSGARARRAGRKPCAWTRR